MIGKQNKKPANRLAAAWRGGVPDHAIALGWSPFGKQLAVAAVSGPVVVFDATTGKELFTLPGHGFGTTAVAYHPSDDDTLATAGQDGKARIWSTLMGDVRHTFEGGSAWVERLAWSRDGSILATAAGKKVRLWNTKTGEQLREYADHGGTVADLAWRPGTNLLAVAAYGAVSIYDPAEPAAVRKYEWKGSALKLAWAPNGAMLAHGNQDSSVHFWYADSGQELHMSGYPSKVTAVDWDFTSRFLATGGGDAVCVWDCAGKGPAGSQPNMLTGHSTVTAVGWQRRGFLLASGDDGGRLMLWQPANRTPLIGGATFEGTEITAVAWSPDDKLLAAGSGAGAVGVFKLT
ncbi:MAG: WD40 repeat domain-containing protein [Fimbriiglobus sp.]|jgi:WD40 repeat protein|nr:WD40 repeat domain-containing protein [Fimbriiglobus sp.]